MSTQQEDEFYKGLQEKLENNNSWPALYLYKFIVPSKGDKVMQISSIFDNMGATIDTKQSKTGKFTSVSIRVNMKSPVAVIAKYKEVGKIEGVISL